ALVQVRVEVRLEDVLEDAELRDLLRLERLRVIEHLAVAVAEGVRRVPALEAEEARLESWRQDRLHERLAVLEVLAAHRYVHLFRQLPHRRDVDGEVGRAVRIRNTGLEAGVGVDLRRRDLRVAGAEPLLELLQRRVDLDGLPVDLGRAAPYRDQAVETVLLLETGDVLGYLLRELGLAGPLLHVLAVELLDPGVLEDRRPGPYRVQLVLDGIEGLARQHARLGRRLVGAVAEDVPAAEDKVVEPGQGHEIIDLRASTLGAEPEANRPHLGQRADRLGQPAADVHHSRDEGRGHGSHARQEDAELPPRGPNIDALFQDHARANTTLIAIGARKT